MHLIRTILSFVVALQLAAASDFSWRGRVGPGQTIEIKGINGVVRAEGASGSEVEVSAIKSARHSDPGSVTIEVVPHADGVTICAVYPSRDRANECRPGSGGRMNVNNNDVKVDFAVRVPAGVHFVGRTVNGEVEGTSLTGDVEAYTVNGKVRISTAGRALAKTVNGSIAARLGKTGGSGPLEFHTVNGGITLELPAGANAQVQASTVNGHISTDFPLMIRGKFSGRRISGSIGQGGPELSLETVNGSIELRRAGS